MNNLTRLKKKPSWLRKLYSMISRWKKDERIHALPFEQRLYYITNHELCHVLRYSKKKTRMVINALLSLLFIIAAGIIVNNAIFFISFEMMFLFYNIASMYLIMILEERACNTFARSSLHEINKQAWNTIDAIGKPLDSGLLGDDEKS